MLIRFGKKYSLLVLLLVSLSTAAVYAQSGFTPTEYVVGKIYLEGNEAFKTRKLKRQMNLKEKRLMRTKTFTRRLIELDRILLKSIYVKNGYLYATVEDSFVVQDNGRVDLYYFITEGRQYFLRQIRIDGNTSLSDDRILELLDHKLDKPYNPLKIRDGIRMIQAEYANNGKPLAQIQDSVSVNQGIHLHIRILENPTMRIGDITIKNNKLVKKRPIEREILLEPGDLYSQEKIDLSKKHIYETGLFSSVNIRTTNIDTQKHDLDLVVEVRELDMRYLGGKVGLGQEKSSIIEGGGEYTSLTLNGEWLHRNIARRGSRLSLNVGLVTRIPEVSELTPNVVITYIEPWLLGFRSSTSFELFYRSEMIEGNLQRKYGEETALIYQPERRFYGSLSFIYQFVFWVGDSSNVEPREDNERAIRFQIRRDYRDNFLFPTRGTVFSFDGKVVGFGGDRNYYWVETSFSQYIPLWRNVVFAYRGKFGYQQPLKVEDDTPTYAWFKLGGGSSLRGWEHDNYQGEGHHIKVLTNAEIRFPLFWILGGEIFIDGGMLSDKESFLTASYRWDAGVGLTLATPLGPIRIDIAKKLGKGDKTPYKWQLSIPYAF